MLRQLESCWLKLERAKEHIAGLRGELAKFISQGPYRFVGEIDRERQLVVFRVEALREPPLGRWAVIVGDAVHNLRSTLDHLVYRLALWHSGGSSAARTEGQRHATHLAADLGLPPLTAATKPNG